MAVLKIDHSEWHEYFMGLATAVKAKSKDPSTKVGAVIVGPGKEVRSTGFNGFPKGVRDLDERYEDRDVKISLAEHAERNAIYFAARNGIPIEGCTMYIAGLPPCVDCARAIVQSGISTVIVESAEIPERWKKACEPALLVLHEGGVSIYTFT